MLRALRYTLYAITGIALGGMAFEVATFPSVSALRDQAFSDAGHADFLAWRCGGRQRE